MNQVIDGKKIAEKMYVSLSKRVGELQKKGLVPHLAVLFVGDDAGSASYIRQKQKGTEKIGAKITILPFPLTVTTEELKKTIKKLNSDRKIQAIIVQKPLPSHIEDKIIDQSVLPEKDIDGFNPQSSFILALPLSVVKILEEVYLSLQQKQQTTFHTWLQKKQIVIIGKGKTGGAPIRSYLQTLNIHPLTIDSQTTEKEKIRLLHSADIIIPAVGKMNVVHSHEIKKGTILVGVGIHRNNEGKLTGDYNEMDIKNVASLYTPTPGGVGPVNVACLMDNLVTATEQQMNKANISS